MKTKKTNYNALATILITIYIILFSVNGQADVGLSNTENEATKLNEYDAKDKIENQLKSKTKSQSMYQAIMVLSKTKRK